MDNPIVIKFKALDKRAKMPEKAYETDAGFDLFAIRKQKLNGNNKSIVPTGLAFNIPEGYYAQIKDRSGMASTTTLKVKAGVIDSGYRGEIGVVMANYGPYPIEILEGDKIAQIIILPVPRVEFKKVGNIGKSPRDKKGFGSTDKKK